MKIIKMVSQSRRDFSAIMECEHCGHQELNKHGYDDDNYHQNVIPAMKCGKCEKTAGDDYEPQATKYSADQVI